MLMPDKFAFEFDEFDMVIVDLTHNLWVPVIVEHAKFLCEIDFVHRLLLTRIKLSLVVYVTMAAILKNIISKVFKGYKEMRIKGISTSMGIAITILIAGFTVQITDNLG